jgi:RNA polymerase sigma-70 factor (ECF subfamily)
MSDLPPDADSPADPGEDSNLEATPENVPEVGVTSRFVGTRVEALDDSDLVAQAVLGDRSSYEALIDRYYQYTLRLAWRGAGNGDDAQDIVQELWGERLPKRLYTFDGAARFSTWLARVTINLTRDRLRRRRWTDHEIDDATRTAADRADLDFDLFLETLDPVESFIAEARFRFDLELDPIAELCGLTTHQVKYRINSIKRAYVRFRADDV